MNDHRRAADDCQVQFAEGIQETEIARFVMRGADDGHHKAHQNAQQNGKERDLHRHQKAVGQVFPAAFLHEIDIKGFFQVQPYIFQPAPSGSVLFGTGSGFNLHGRISVPYFLQLSGGFQCCNGAVNILKESRISLADGNGVGFGSEGLRQNFQPIIARYVHCCRILVNDGGVHLACRHGGHSQRSVREAFRLLDVPCDVNVSRGPVLHSDSFAADIFPLPDGRTFGNDDNLSGFHIGNGEVHFPPAFRRNRDSGGGYVRLSGNYSRNHGIKAHVLNDQLPAGAPGYLPHDFRVNAQDGVSVPEFVGRESRFRHHQDSAVFRRWCAAA